MALIAVDARGENSIIVVPGANSHVSVADVEVALGRLEDVEGTTVLVCQNEIPQDATAAALRVGRERGFVTVFNPAPAPADVSTCLAMLRHTDVLVVNESEAVAIAGGDDDEALRRVGVPCVIKTRGSRGCVLLVQRSTDDVQIDTLPAVSCSAPVLDTTGAGDCFVGALAAELSISLPRPPSSSRSASTASCLTPESIHRAIGVAQRAAAASVTRRGTQTSFPTRAELSLPPTSKLSCTDAPSSE
jgi:ribokinase